MKFETGHAVAEIDQRSPRVLAHNTRAILQRLENNCSGLIGERLVLFSAKVVKELLAVLLLIEGFHARVQHSLNIRRYGLAFFFYSRHGFLNADGVPDFERSQ